ncbi:MAG: hypothetical protein HN580_10690 [Deltaproteobacteria bacterium]|jgi:pentatricopeptide repeat protein|nr:hypothetical protein [Deltaproteobacteria bacterium]MBT4263121.1 hypothetical protein [Deltaproteobacteria bacterium]MBT4637343.1 hypothetical protein [Deltaproteobacteria bacterium]MBT6504823.1 hypothetical protein [Deltaproteobacteria bacterium]MBT6610823.1 hypothetical protein [Deltaproteobacteria bacterium]
MKYFFSIAFLTVFLVGSAFGACPERQKSQPRSQSQQSQQSEGTPQVCLESFELCNNWARHYCRNGNHEKMVNHILQQMKERGMTITTTIIKSVARRTLKNTAPPPVPVEE